MTHLEVQPDGRIFVIDGMPEKRTIGGKTYEGIADPGTYSGLKAEYEKALASAPRILVSDQQRAKRLIKEKYGHDLDEMNINTSGYIYQVDCEWEEITWSKTTGFTDEADPIVSKTRVAILKESPKEEAIDPVSFYKWMVSEGWEEHSSREYFFKLEYRSEWPPKHGNMATESELLNLYLTRKKP